eukprot:CAMPEP_0197561316 /NCGR_PEP_ID=MMETSP1320-20131121/24897_1 /TAXON_ID=91990 /ORGANISM="Bolidomonas sp., Strain RCC2347" /LENGTH=455 /DNA_ID=CAMNT_0043122939 /DNA_START=149 /DNA_END=1513 /DNA_ORIENTATION=-
MEFQATTITPLGNSGLRPDRPYVDITEIALNEPQMDRRVTGERRKQRKGLVEKRSWSRDEDEYLRRVVMSHGGNIGTLSWTQIAAEFSQYPRFAERSGKQCRERYANHLHPGVRKGGWTKEEDLLIRSLQKELGNQWAKMVRYLPGRSDNSIKNRFWSFQRSKERKKDRLLNSGVVAISDAGLDQAVDDTRKYRNIISRQAADTPPTHGAGIRAAATAAADLRHNFINMPEQQSSSTRTISPMMQNHRIAQAPPLSMFYGADAHATMEAAGKARSSRATRATRATMAKESKKVPQPEPEPEPLLEGAGLERPEHFIDGHPVMKRRRVSDASTEYVSGKNGKPNLLKKTVSIEESDSENEDENGDLVVPMNGYSHLLDREKKNMHGGIAIGGVAYQTSGPNEVSPGHSPTGAVADSFTSTLVTEAPHVAAIRVITEEEFLNSRIIFNWPVSMDRGA